MKLSVAMCTYNGVRFLKEQLQSIAEQTRLPDELIVCDDQSTDGTVEMVHEWAKRAPFSVRVATNKRNLGSTKNFERAIELCQGDLIALADQDDVWMPGKLERLEMALAARPMAGLAFSDGELVDEQLRSVGRSTWEVIHFDAAEQLLFREGHTFEELLKRNVVTGAAMCFRASFKPLALPLPTDLMHDGWPVIHDGWIALVVSAVSEVICVPERLIKYRLHARQQIGVRGALEDGKPQANLGHRVREASYRVNSFAPEVYYVRQIIERLNARPAFEPRPRVLADLRARLAHLEARAAMPESRLRRVPPVMREFLTRRYHAYSNGIYSAAKDLWRGNSAA